MAIHLLLSRGLFLLLIVGCGQVPAELEESSCIGSLSLEQRGLLMTTHSRVISIKSPDYPNSLKAINEMQQKRQLGEDNYSVACVVVTFTIGSQGKPEKYRGNYLKSRKTHRNLRHFI